MKRNHMIQDHSETLTQDLDVPAKPRFARWLGTTNVITKQFLSLGGRPEIINLAGGLPAPAVYPVAALAEAARDAMLKGEHRALGYSAIEGLADLRDAIARQYSVGAVRLTRDNVMITAGSMQALDLLGKIFIEPGDVIVGHYPTYLGAIDAWRPREPAYRHLKLDPTRPDALPSFDGAKFVYVVPNFSNPTGALVDATTRRALLAAAERANSWVVEDDPYGELVYDGEPLPSMLALSAEAEPGPVYDGRVIYLGTISKTMAPGLRVGWTIAAPTIIAALTLAKQGSDLCTGGVQQAIALEAMERGLVARQKPVTNALYRERRDALCAAIATHLDPWFTWQKPTGGMFVWLNAKEGAIDTDALLSVAFREGVAYTPSSVFDPTGALKTAMRMNFTLNPPDVLAEGVARLGRAVRLLAG